MEEANTAADFEEIPFIFRGLLEEDSYDVIWKRDS